MATESKINEDVVAVPVPQGTLDAVSNGTFYNPHEVLGGHLGSGKHADVVTIRVLRPLAKSVTIITEQGQTLAIHEYNGVFMHSFPPPQQKRGTACQITVFARSMKTVPLWCLTIPIVICRPSARWTCIYSAKAVTSACGSTWRTCAPL